jgi:aryl-alcohol dehydrogenase
MSTLWGKKVIGTFGGEGRSWSLIRALIRLNQQGRSPYDKLIKTFPLEQVSEAFEASRSGGVVKPVLLMPS